MSLTLFFALSHNTQALLFIFSLVARPSMIFRRPAIRGALKKVNLVPAVVKLSARAASSSSSSSNGIKPSRAEKEAKAAGKRC